MDLIMLAGGKAEGQLARHSESGFKSLIKFGGEYMVNLCLDNFRKAKLIKRIFVVGPPEIKSRLREGLFDEFVEERGAVIENVLFTLEKPGIDRSRKVLVSACDIPLVGPRAIDNFAGFCVNSPYEAIYPVVTKDVYDEKYSSAPRTWFYCAENVYTGGNFVAVLPEAVFRNETIIRKVYENRKNPLKLAALFGIKVILRYQAGMLTKKDVEAAVTSAIKIPSFGFVSACPELVVDVDKPADYSVILDCLERRG